MQSWYRSRRLPFVIAALLLVLLAALATLQWRWIGELSDMERQRLQAGLYATGVRFGEDFDRELTRVFLYFHPERMDVAPDRLTRVVEQWERWQAEAPYPRLVHALYLVRAAGRGGEDGVSLEALLPRERRFAAVAWPPELAAARDRLELEVRGSRSGSPPDPPFAHLRGLAADLPGFVFPLSFGAVDAHDPLAGAVLLVQLDRQAIAGEVLPALMRRHFGSSEGIAYAVAVIEAADPTRTVFVSDPTLPRAAFERADARVDMFGLRPLEELRASLPGHAPHAHPPQPPPWPRFAFALHAGRHAAEGWTVLVKRRDGSLEEAVATVRRHNLAISAGILGLIGITVVTFALSAQRAQRLARQQIEFVAGVTHELHTPLAAIRSAGENLADGVVVQPEQVKRYGALVEREGRRLTDMVGQMLEFAGIQSGRRTYRLEPTAVADVLAGALADSRWLLESSGLSLERNVAGDLPPLLADGAALRRAVKNLIENAVKHGAAGGWLGLQARRGAPGEVVITVADRGPGIRRDELPHLFEPFFRGRQAAAGGAPGAGLGLSLVRHIVEGHGGRVSVESGGAGGGSAFSLHLPAAPGRALLEPAERPV